MARKSSFNSNLSAKNSGFNEVELFIVGISENTQELSPKTAKPLKK